MHNRAEVVDNHFREYVLKGRFPERLSETSMGDVDLKPSEVMDLFESQVISRQLDLKARLFKARGQCFYTIGSSGHEGNAACGKVFGPKDMAFLHYRSGAFMVQRAKHVYTSTPIYDTLLSLMASSEDPISGGRHKVWGSFPLNVPPQTSTIASHLPKSVGAALSIHRTKDLKVPSALDHDSVVICSFGDASANHSSALGAFSTTRWVAHQNIPIPLVFICEDNHLGISLSSPKGWLKESFSKFKDLTYIKADGLNLLDVYAKSREAEELARRYKKPVFLHLEVIRLMGHAGSDVETSYRSLKDIEATELNDPLLHSARLIRENDWLSSKEIVNLYDDTSDRVERVGQYVTTRPRLLNISEVGSTLNSCASPKVAPPKVSERLRHRVLGREKLKMSEASHMAKLINWGLTDILLRYPNTLIFGEDVAEKGGVYHVTDKLQERFGPKRVFNSILDEQSILGTAIGLAHNSLIPIPEIQFLAYVHNAEDQIRGEAATLAFFSCGQFTNPMVIRIAGLAYQKGFGGHFHNDNSLSVFKDIPGLILAVPSRGDDAVKMLRSCVRMSYERGRVVVFIEPIARYMTKDLHREKDALWSFVYPELEEEIPLGEFGVYGREQKDFCILTYGNGTYYSLQAKKVLEDEYGLKLKLIDLRWLSDMNYEKLVAEVEGAKSILIVDECRRTGSIGESLMSHLYERISLGNTGPQMKILAADDCLIPLGEAASTGLPKKEEIIKASLELLALRA